ncbi:MAG: hypothetical protein F6J92_20430 [Symploca sp. SIO1A3]|nr:hypothetical protein [Symploca sp. SIO1A3]
MDENLCHHVPASPRPRVSSKSGGSPDEKIFHHQVMTVGTLLFPIPNSQFPIPNSQFPVFLLKKV